MIYCLLTTSGTECHCTVFVVIVTGTTLNYFLDDKINKAEILFPGVGCFLVAAFLGSAVHSSNTADNKAKLNDFSSDYKDAAQYVLFVYNYFWDMISDYYRCSHPNN